MKEELDKKYARLLLQKCLNFTNTDTLLIEYETHEQDDFVKIIIEEARNLQIRYIQTCCGDRDMIREYLLKTDISDIKLNPLIDRSSWDETAKKHGCILHINTFIPNIMDDVDLAKITQMNKAISPTFSYYRENLHYNFPWVICAYPNKRWADFLFNSKDAYERLHSYIMQMCMVDEEDPIQAWDEYIKLINGYKTKLEDMDIQKLHYQNSLGTDFEIGFPKNYRWLNLDKTDNFGSPIIVNMPSYEIFTTPDYHTASGIVYNSKPLIYKYHVIDKFYLEFKDGVVVDYKAEVGNEYLKSLIEDNHNSARLGEVALVNNDSPISNTGIIFYNTLFDENASCHLALGNGNTSTIAFSESLTSEQLDELGINKSNVHVDFMIGTEDLEITASTKQGKKLVFKKGNFVI